MTGHAFVVVAVGILGFGLVSARLERSVLTPPMAFTIYGVLVGPLALGLIEIDLESHWVEILSELTLILILFTDATRIDLRLLGREHKLPVRLLLIGMPLTIGFGLLAAIGIFPWLGVWEAALLAAILAPTDAALGQAVVSDTRVPVRVRQGLNVESGLNDGIALPVVLLFVSCTGMAEGAQPAEYWARFAALQLIVGPLAGVLVGWLGGKAVDWCTRHRWMNRAFQQLSAVGLALLAYAGAELAGGNGFIAAFVAGLTLGNVAKGVCECLYEFGESEGQLLALLVFMVLGVAMVPIALLHLDGATVLYAVLSLTVIRMLPVAISLVGSGFRKVTWLFAGWFGPRGIASLLFAMLVVENEHLPQSERLFAVVVTTVVLSVLAHGVTAFPGAAWFARRAQPGECPMEHTPLTEMPARSGHHAPESQR